MYLHRSNSGLRTQCNRLAGRILAAFAIVMVVLFIVIKTSTGRAISRSSPPNAASTSQPQTPRLSTVELLTVKPTGFDPAEITVPHQSFLLAIENRSGLDELSFRFDREVGPTLRDVRVRPKRTSWTGIVDLPPGKYKLTETNHPNWSCTITITPR
jgi:hypothetical protein